MRHVLPAAVGVICGLATPTLGATVTYDVRIRGSALTEITVAPGTPVEYEITAKVASDTAVADNHGLASFTVHVRVGTDVVQVPLEAFSDVVTQHFTFGQSLGTGSAGLVQDISAAQLGLGSQLHEGVGVDQAAVLGRGKIQTPTTETSFTAKIEVSADQGSKVAGAGSQQGRVVAAASAAGPGITIRTSNAAPTPEPTPASDTTLQLLAILGGSVLALLASYWIGGPIGLMIGLLVVPLIGLVFLMT